jgi:hypothetical protein
MDLVGMSEREYWANVAKRPGMFVGQATLAGLEGYLAFLGGSNSDADLEFQAAFARRA